MVNEIHLSSLEDGTVVCVRMFGVLTHVGVLSSRIDGARTVIFQSFSHQKAVELPHGEFTGGRLVSARANTGRLPPWQIVANARAQIGEPYDLLSNNCEHLVSRAEGLRADSPQVRRWVILGAAMFLVGALSRA